MSTPSPSDPNIPEPTKNDRTADASISDNNEGYVILLSGTHVTGKETIAFSLAQSLKCPWIKGEAAHAAANFGARAQASRENGLDYHGVFQRIWLAKMLRLGLEMPSSSIVQIGWEGNGGMGTAGGGSQTQESGPGSDDKDRNPKGKCLAVITTYATRHPVREAIRSVLAKYAVKPIFVILQITKETLSGRTLGAEEAELAEWVMHEKEKDIERPGQDEMLGHSVSGKDQGERGGDIVMVESDDGRSVDELFAYISQSVQVIILS